MNRAVQVLAAAFLCVAVSKPLARAEDVEVGREAEAKSAAEEAKAAAADAKAAAAEARSSTRAPARHTVGSGGAPSGEPLDPEQVSPLRFPGGMACQVGSDCDLVKTAWSAG